MAIITNREYALKNKTEHAYVTDVGYLNRGPLKMPPAPIHPPQFCEPEMGAKDQSLHMLKAPQSPPDNAVGEVMTWHASTKEWQPMLGTGRRLAFSSAYLAAHGWLYAGPVESEVRPA